MVLGLDLGLDLMLVTHCSLDVSPHQVGYEPCRLVRLQFDLG